MTNMARAWKQRSLDEVRKPTGHGGWRPGAGRPAGHGASHQRRPSLSKTAPLHVTLRLAAGVPSIRRVSTARVVQAAIKQAHSNDFRVVHFSIMANHLHLLVEAANREALTRGMHRLTIRLALRMNAALRRKGTVFGERYHARALKTPREVRLALRYVLLNARHHAAERGEYTRPGWIDPFSSGRWFDGWRQAWATAGTSGPTAAARTWLLRDGWRVHGAIDVDDTPGRRASVQLSPPQ